jgi:hypothetical protein
MRAGRSTFHAFGTNAEAEAAIRSLAESGFDVHKLSLVGKGQYSDAQPNGFYTLGDRIKAWGGIGAYRSGVWGLLLPPAVFFLPELGLMAMTGPLVFALVGALDGRAVARGASPLAAALAGIGLPKEDVAGYIAALKADQYVLLAQGRAPRLFREPRHVLVAPL